MNKQCKFHPLIKVMLAQRLSLVLLIVIAGLCGCGTIEGAGKDMQSGGSAVSDAARSVKESM